MTTLELIERGVGHNCLSDAYELGKADAIEEAKQKQRVIIDEDGVMYKVVFLKDIEEMKAEIGVTENV